MSSNGSFLDTKLGYNGSGIFWTIPDAEVVHTVKFVYRPTAEVSYSSGEGAGTAMQLLQGATIVGNWFPIQAFLKDEFPNCQDIEKSAARLGQ